MKIKYIMIISLLLIVLTIGAVSATDNVMSDNLTADMNNHMDDALQVEDSLQIYGDPGNYSSFTDLAGEIETIENELILTKDYMFTDNDTIIEITKNDYTIDGNGHTIDAKSNTGIFNVKASSVVLKNINFKNGNVATNGGAIIITGDTCNVINCTFTNCSANNGGAICKSGIHDTIDNCTFINCSAGYGGAIKFTVYDGSVGNSIFINCSASQDGGAIHSDEMGDSFYKCSFINCSSNQNGGAICWLGNQGYFNTCNFTNCSADKGGAFYNAGTYVETISNCRFIKCDATTSGGAIYSTTTSDNCTVTNSKFTDNTAANGPAVYDNSNNLEIKNSNFVDNSAAKLSDVIYGGIISNCTLNGNIPADVDLEISIASNLTEACQIGDSIEFTVTVTNKGSTDATGAIVTIHYSESLTIKSRDTLKGSTRYGNSTGELIWTIGNMSANETTTLTLTVQAMQAGNATLIASIDSAVNDTNSMNNMAIDMTSVLAKASTLTIDTNITGSIVTLTFTVPEDATGNISVTVNGENFNITTANGTSVLNLNLTAGTYLVSATYLGDANYMPTTANKTFTVMSDMSGNISAPLKSATLTIDADITGNDVTLTFTVPEDATGNISVIVDGMNYVLNPVNGTSILNLNLTAGDYLVSATYGGDAQYKSANNETSFTVPAISENTFNDLKNLIDAAGPTLTLTDDFIYSTGDSGFITINKTITIDGNGHTLDANNKSRVFIIYADGVTLKNIVFKNGNISDYGGAVEWFGANGTISNSNFTNCYCSENGGAVHWKNGANGTISNSNFTNCYAKIGGGAVHWELGANGIVYNSTFINCSADVGAGAVQWDAGANGTVSNSRFINCSAGIRGGAVEWYYWFESEGAILNSIFINCFAGEEGGAVEWYGVNGTIDDSKFINCSAANDGGAVYWSGTNGTISDSIFINCSAGNGGVLYWLKGANGILSDSIFINCSAANDGGAVHWRELYDGDNGTVSNSRFINCSANGNGSAIFWSSPNGTIENSDFSQFDATKNHVIYVTSNNTIISACDFVNENITQLDEVIYGGTVVDCTINGNSQKFIDLSITMTSNATICQIGDSIEFTVTVTNNGPSDATGTYVSLIYPDMAIQNSYNTVNGSVGSGNSSGEMYWTIGNLPAGQTATLAIIGEPVELGNITYALTAYSSVNDTDTTNNAAYSLISVIAKASTLTIDTNISGSSVTLTFTVPADATGNISVIVYGMNYVLNPVSGISTLNRNFTAGEYLVLATYSGDANYMPTTANKTFTVGAIAGNTFTDLQNLIDAAGSTLNLTDDYIYSAGDSDFITIDKTITIDGAGHTINGNNTQRAFLITADNVVLKNINFDHCRLGFDYGGTIYWQGNNGTLTYCNFTNCYGTSGSSGPIYWQGDDGKLTACNFVNCTSTETPGGAINWFGNNGTVANSRFTNCSSTYGSGGVINWGNTSGIIEKSDFTTFEAQMEAHALYLSNDNIIVRNCRFNDERYESFNEIIIGGNVIDCTLNGNAPIKIIDLSLIINSNITSCNIGDMIEITVVANNAGPDDATGAYVTLDCPISLSIKSQDTLKGSAGYGNGTGDLIWTIGNLTSGESATLTITAQAIQTGNMTLTGSISANENDENAANNMALTQITSLVKASTLTIDANITGNNVTLTFTLKENNNTIQNEIINIMIGDANFNKTTDENGMCIITSNFPAGEYQVSATYGGNDYYMAAYNETSFTVQKKTATLTIDTNITSNNVTLTFTIPEDATGNISVIVDGTNYVLNSFDGISVLNRNFNPGTYQIIATYNGDANYLAANNETSFTVQKKSATLTINANVTGNNVTLTFTIPEDATGNITCHIGDVNYVLNPVNGKYTLTNEFEPGTYQVSATYNGDANYMTAQDETTFTVMATNTFTYLQKLIDESGQTLALTNDFIYSAGDSGQIIINKTVTIDGAGHTIDANHQSRIFTITANEVILKNINFKNGRETANGGSIYWSGNSGRLTNCSFTDSSSDANGGAIYWQGADGKVEDSRFTDCSALQNGGSIYWIGSNGTVSNSDFTNKNESKAAIHATSNDVEIIKSNFDRKSAVEGGTMKQCTYDEIEAKNATEITLTANNIEIGDFQIIEANLEGNTTGNITFKIYKNNTLVKTSTAAIIGGSASIVIRNLGIGNYRVEAIYPGDESYNETSKSTTFKVRPKVTISQGVSVGSKTNIYIDFGENITDTLIVKIDKKTFAVLNIEKGIVNYTFSTAKLKEGNREVTIDYEGDLFDKTLITSESYDMYLIPEEIPIPEEIKSTDDGVVTLEFPINATGTLTVYIDGEAQEIIDVGKELKKFIAQSNKTVEEIVIGLLKINLSKYKGNYTITFEYSGDENYQAFEKEANATIYVNPAIIQASNANVLYSAGPTYTIKVYSDKNVLAKSGKVIIKANNKAFKTLTIKNGIASFKVTQVPGTYKLTISALGKTKTTTLTVKHVVTLKTVTVKRSAKKLVLQATLSKVNKKYLKNKKITFKFNGKTYKAKTNKKGVAKVTIKSTVLKKLKVGKKVTYQATYLKDTVKKTAKIKK